MAKYMMTLQLDPSEANLTAVSRRLNLKEDEIDPNFGVVNIDPVKNLYTILVDEAVATKLQGSEGIEGPYSNPKIETCGLWTRDQDNP
jgi:hypothetical protein